MQCTNKHLIKFKSNFELGEITYQYSKMQFTNEHLIEIKSKF